MERRFAAATVIVALAVLVGACGGGGGSGGPAKLTFWAYNAPAETFDSAVKYCSEHSNGEYEISFQRLSSDANQQRQSLVRRLAAKDSSIDLMAMDVIWTAEFAEAKWIKPFPDDVRQEVSKDTLKGALATATYKDKLYGAPANSNTQLLWYRKDKLKGDPPKTWDELIKTAESMKTKIEVQGAAYEGYTVWIDALIQSAGGTILASPAKASLSPGPTQKALDIISALAKSSAADPSIANSKEDTGRLAFEAGDADFQINYPFIWPSAAEIKGFQDKIGWAPYPRVDANTPAKAPIGGFNFGVGNYTKHAKEAFDAAACMRNERNQRFAAVEGGLPPTLNSLYDNKDFQKDYPFAQLIRQSINDGAVRPRTPLYSDLSLAIATALSPPSGFDAKAEAGGGLKTVAQDALDGKGLN